MIEEEELTPFHLDRTWSGHGPSRFPHWIRSKSNSTSYPIVFEPRFEPYVLGYKNDTRLPEYWPGFRGFGFNKWTWFVEAHYMGFQFAALRQFFVVHLDHQYDHRVLSTETVHQLLLFQSYMKNTYNNSNEELRKFGATPMVMYGYYEALSSGSTTIAL